MLQLFENQFIRNLSLMGLSQIANRVFRLTASIVVARLLFPEDYGIAALALSVNEIIHVLVRGAVVNKLVQSTDDEIESLSRTAYWVNWVLCIGLLVLQALVAIGLGWWHAKLELGLAIAALGLTYLVLPFATIQMALTLRANRLAATAKSDTLQTIMDSGLTILMALSGFGFWALIIPKLLVAPIWALVYRRAQHWQITGKINFTGWRKLFSFGRHIVAADAVVTLRNNMDYLIIAQFLGMEALGIYFFAYNAGLGVTQGFINAFTTTLYPHLCSSNDTQHRIARYKKTLKKVSLVVLPVIVLQATLAPFYIPIVFGERWVDEGAIPLVVLICLSALTRPFAESASQLLRASGRPEIDFIWQLLFTLILGLAIFTGLGWGLTGIALATLAVHLLLQPAFALWATTNSAKPADYILFKFPWSKQSC
jgi:PST family polysaccharide transporter